MRKGKKMTLSDLEKNFTKKTDENKGFFSTETNEKKSAPTGWFQKIKYFFSSDNKEAAQHLVIIMGVLVLILLSCAAINRVESDFDPQSQQTVAESILSGNKTQITTSAQSQAAAESAKTAQKSGTKQTTAAQDNEGEALNSDDDYFINYEMERKKVRSEQLDLLNDMVDSSNTLPEVKKEAENKILAITKNMENELLLESLLVAKYGGEAVVFVQEDKVNVILRPQSGKINDQEADKIAQLVDTYTKIGYENAVIVVKD